MTFAPVRFRGHYEICGQGAPILCLAGFGCDSWIFEDMAATLSPNYQLIMPHNRGMGRSPRETSDYHIEDLARDALGLMDDLGLSRFHVMGVSMGGFIAQALALLAPHRVERLLLLCTSSGGDAFVPLPPVSEQDLVNSYRLDAVEASRLTLERTLHPNFRENQPGAYQRLMALKRAHRADLDQVLLQRRAVVAFLQKSLPLASIGAPTLVMSGAGDAYVDPDNSRILAERLGNARCVYISETNHLFFLEKHEEVCREITRFLEEPQ